MEVFTKNNGTFEPKKDIEFTGNKKEEEFETLLFDNPEIFPVCKIAASTAWIPLVRQLSIRNHGALDIFATDNSGNIYIVECKIKGNSDMKTIRGQITDYVAGLWNEKDEWDNFLKRIKERSFESKSLEEILEKVEDVNDVSETIENIKKNYEDGKYFLVYAVNRITPGLQDMIRWHNGKLDQNNNYPSFALEIQKFPGENNSEVIVTQNFPYDLDELKIKNEKRNYNVETDWQTKFDQMKLTSEHKDRIIEFKEKIKSLVSKNNGDIDYGTGAMPRLMPKFFSTNRRSAIGINANGILKLQFHLIGSYYPEEGEMFKRKIFDIEEIKTIIDKSKSKKDIPLDPEQWLPHRDRLLSILEEVFVKE